MISAKTDTDRVTGKNYNICHMWGYIQYFQFVVVFNHEKIILIGTSNIIFIMVFQFFLHIQLRFREHDMSCHLQTLSNGDELAVQRSSRHSSFKLFGSLVPQFVQLNWVVRSSHSHSSQADGHRLFPPSQISFPRYSDSRRRDWMKCCTSCVSAVASEA